MSYTRSLLCCFNGHLDLEQKRSRIANEFVAYRPSFKATHVDTRGGSELLEVNSFLA